MGLIGLPLVVRVTLNAHVFRDRTRVTGTGLFLTTT